MKRFILILGLCGAPAFASDYPPGYTIETSCQAKGPVEVCAFNQHYGTYPRLSIRYHGQILGGEKSAYVRLNGRSAVFPLTSDDALNLNSPNSYRCWEGGVPDGFVGPYEACLYSDADKPTGALVWEVEPIPAREKDLFFYARNEHGLANAWDLEVAVVDGEGRWDSLYGLNYKFRFEAY